MLGLGISALETIDNPAPTAKYIKPLLAKAAKNPPAAAAPIAAPPTALAKPAAAANILFP